MSYFLLTCFDHVANDKIGPSLAPFFSSVVVAHCPSHSSYVFRFPMSAMHFPMCITWIPLIFWLRPSVSPLLSSWILHCLMLGFGVADGANWVLVLVYCWESKLVGDLVVDIARWSKSMVRRCSYAYAGWGHLSICHCYLGSLLWGGSSAGCLWEK